MARLGLILFFAIIFTFEYGLALKCIFCYDNCDKQEEEMCMDLVLNGLDSRLEMMCLTQITKNTANSEVSTTRKCAYARIGEKYNCVSFTGQEITQCYTCNFDFCNKLGATQNGSSTESSTEFSTESSTEFSTESLTEFSTESSTELSTESSTEFSTNSSLSSQPLLSS